MILTDLAPHNLGIINNQVIVFDYHGLHKLRKDGKIKRQNWWRRIARNLVRFICAIYCPQKRKEFVTAMQNCDSSAIYKLEQDNDLPSVFVELIKYMYHNENKASVTIICEYLESCIELIKQDFKDKKRNKKKHSQSTDELSYDNFPKKHHKNKKYQSDSDSNESDKDKLNQKI
jgi:hypothetical protein